MENKIISINISPENDEEINENAGVMWEHNATSLVFNIDHSYVGDYRYYIEYRSLIGTKVRTEYLELNTTTDTITYDIPVTMSSLKGVECYFNIINIDEDGQTVQVIKPKKFCLEFDYSPDTDNSIAKVNDFSINALLDAIRLGLFKGDKGEKGDKGDKGDKGEKGDPGEITKLDTEMSDVSSNVVQNKVIKKYIDNNNDVKKITEECNAWELPEGLYKIDNPDTSFSVNLSSDGEHTVYEGMLIVIKSILSGGTMIFAFIIDDMEYKQKMLCVTVDSDGAIVENISAGYLATKEYVDRKLSDLEKAVADLNLLLAGK